MSVMFLLGALALLGIGVVVPIFLSRAGGWVERAAILIGTGGGLLGSLAGLFGTASALLLDEGMFDRTFPWPLPIGALHLGLDPLSAFFLCVLFLVGFLATLHGHGWMKRYLGARRLFYPTALFNLLLAATALILMARDGILFLFSWELMSLATFFLIAYDDTREEARRAGLIYLIASHASLVLLMLFFGTLAHRAGDFDFSHLPMAARAGGTGGLFLLALGGFGIKAGFWPGHVWLPDAYPEAPPQVASVMSGVLLKLGIYGLLRALLFLGPPAAWWGELLIAVGVASACIGVLLALAQIELTRLCAYSSIENLGIIAIAIGLSVLARAQKQEALALAAMMGGLVHLFNHALFKGALFQAVGSIGAATGTRRLDALGGLIRRMPWTALIFFLASWAIMPLPPLNGFIGEWQVVTSAFRAAGLFETTPALFALLALVGLAAAGGFVVACFVRAFGIAFLGTPRGAAAAEALERPRAEWMAPLIGVALCLLLGLFPFVTLDLAYPVAHQVLGAERGLFTFDVTPIVKTSFVLLALMGALVALRVWLLRGRERRVGPVWACGYPGTSPRIQYTAASFTSPLLAPFRTLLPRRVTWEPVEGYFPARARSEEHYGDLAGERLVLPMARRVLALFGRLRVLQHGHLHVYLLYVLATLIALLVWQLAT